MNKNVPGFKISAFHGFLVGKLKGDHIIGLLIFQTLSRAHVDKRYL